MYVYMYYYVCLIYILKCITLCTDPLLGFRFYTALDFRDG